jgi:hypothetical protein
MKLSHRGDIYLRPPRLRRNRSRRLGLRAGRTAGDAPLVMVTMQKSP